MLLRHVRLEVPNPILEYVNWCLEYILSPSCATQTWKADGDMAMSEYNTWDDIGDSVGDPAYG